MSSINGIEHIGITVPDHDKAIAFFDAAFGVEQLFSQTDTNGGPMPASQVGRMNGLRKGTKMLKVSVLRFKNGPNLEVFEIDQPAGSTNDNIADYGITHFSVNVDDIDAASARFTDAGGELLSEPYDLGAPEDGAGNRGVFGRTPWGLLIEMEQFKSPMTYKPSATEERWLPES